MLFFATAQVVAQSYKNYYVTAEATEEGDGSSWENPMKLEKALNAAQAGDKIYVKGYETLTQTDKYYLPSTKEGFLLKSGVSLYGGCSGSGTERPTTGETYKMQYQSVLLGDLQHNDEVDATLLMFPLNPTRTDNAYHVLTVDLGVSESHKNDNSLNTVVEGFTIAGGSAHGTVETDPHTQGGGIYIINSSDESSIDRSYQISNCFFVNNFGYRGGAIFVSDKVNSTKQCYINNNLFYNNLAGRRSGSQNMAGAIWAAGTATIYNSLIFNNVNGGIRLSDKSKMVNSTVVHNTVSGIDLIAGNTSTVNGGGSVFNSVFWGNTILCKRATYPIFKNCAFPEVTVTNPDKNTDDNGNLKISEENFDGEHPAAWFFTPSSTMGYDRSFNRNNSTYPTYNFSLEEQSALLNMGNTQSEYTTLIGTNDSKDLAGNTRFYNDRTDIGAYQRERLAANRRQYVKPTATGRGDGSSWDNATDNIQTAINNLWGDGKQGRGEVWIAAGTYTPSSSVDVSTGAANTPQAFQMRDGISLIGGFAGNETSRTERHNTDMKWNFGSADGSKKYETILQGVGFAGTPTWSTTNGWNINSSSYHVVWFAPSPGGAPFQYPTYIDGVTIQGGSHNQTSVNNNYAPTLGAGVYMNDGNANLRNCVVRYNDAGQATQGSKGGGVYCQGGQVRYCLVYNNSAESGGGVYLETVGFVNNSMLSNNSAKRGAGVYLKQTGDLYPLMQILAVSVVTNNTSTENGAVYVDGSGLVEQNTIVNNTTANTTDEAAENLASRTGGLYITKQCVAVNNIMWNNSLTVNSSTSGSSANRTSSSYAQVYAGSEATKSTALLYNNGISDFNAATWNNITQQGTYEMSSEYSGKAFDPAGGFTAEDFIKCIGVQGWPSINYYWQTKKGSMLRGKGLLYTELPEDVMFKPSTDMLERNFDGTPPIGAYLVEANDLVFEKKDNTLRLYYANDTNKLDGNGSSWSENVSSLDDVIDYLGSLSVGDDIQYVGTTGTGGSTIKTYKLTANDKFEICLREGTISPTKPYSYQENEAKAKTFDIPAISFPLSLIGGYPAASKVATPTDADRSPSKYRTEFNGNPDGNELSDGFFHVFRVETGANVTFDGIAITHGYAAGTAFITTGGGMLIGSQDVHDAKTQVTLRNSIIENNTASDGAAIGMVEDTKNVELKLKNCVVNNNTCLNDIQYYAQDLFFMGDASNKLTLEHVTLVNNLGAAPANIGTSSFAAGNKINQRAGESDDAHNTISLNTLGADGAKNFSNPTKELGAKMNANVYYGGNAEFRPITSSLETNGIINQAQESADFDLTTDINGNDRNLGGAPDLGAYEALLPKAGRVIYVRSYNQTWLGKGEKNDLIDGNPDFNLLAENEGKEYDGSTWDKAIMGNAICKEKEDRKGNNFYVTEDGKLLPATIDFTKYSNDYNASSAPYGQQSKAYSSFFMSGTGTGTGTGTGNGNGNRASQWDSQWGSYNLITNNRDEDYISGLQYAVEKAAEWNATHPGDSIEVWVGAGVYTDFKGFVIRDKVKVYGGFKKEGNPGESDRHPLFSQYVAPRKEYQDEKASDYETILQVRKEAPVYLTKSSRELWWAENKSWDGCDNGFIDQEISAGKIQRHSVLYQPDTSLPTWGISGDNQGRTGANTYRYEGTPYADTRNYHEYAKGQVKWDGFTIRHGYITNYEANRDGGSGVRCFRGIELENLIIVNNLTHGKRSRGGGLYMDGDNSQISNSYLLQNMVWGSNDCYGGGAYMIQGTGFNMVVASNRSLSQGGGIFIESAKFYNNTVAYNMANNVTGTGIMHWQDNTTGIESQLTLYNCLVYDNMRNNGVTAGTTNIGTSNASKFRGAYNCYVSGNLGSLASKFTAADGNITGDNLKYPFAVNGYDNGSSDIRWRTARSQNDFHLNEADGLAGNPCLNGGTQNVGNVSLPNTDMDYTNRIKDCEIDIGAYEADNTTNITAQEKVNVEGTTEHAGVTDYVFYVTRNGSGTRSGDSPENAACADKLQSVLTKAGELAKQVNNNFEGISDATIDHTCHKVYVKVAGYELDDDGTQFVYHPNTLADANDPQSYTFLIPDGVWLMGGYNEGEYEGGKPKASTSNWDDNKRNVTQYKTILSAKTEVKEGSTVPQEVNGYHTICFGAWPTGEINDYNNTALKYRAVADGIYLTDGLATDNAGFKGMGGAAVVPRRAHVRNCVITQNQALQGGALMLLQGGMVSGSLIMDNTAEEGGALYAACGEKTDGTANYHAYAASCTIAKNKAEVGGAIYQELGALMVGNSVIWGNEAPMDKNISGVVDQQFEDVMQAQASNGKRTKFYPYNFCFVERYAVPSDVGNTVLASDAEQYFTNEVSFYPRAYSILIEQGVDVNYQALWLKMGVQGWDLYGNERNETTNLTAGCYAISMPVPDKDKLLTRLYVSQSGGADVSDADRKAYLGRSFYTPFSSLDAALSYIKEARKNELATDETKFQILMAEGTYKPSVAREVNSEDLGGGTVGTINTNRRLQSFEIPVNVDIFGSFNHENKTFSNPQKKSGTEKQPTTLTLKDKDGKDIVTLTKGGNIHDLLNARNTNEMVDNNQNGLIEPWEFAYPTILSGDIKASSTERKVYHVVYSEIKDSDLTSAQKNNDVMLDGITIMNGETQDEIDYIEGTDEEKINEIGHGGGIYSKNVSYTLNRCRILNNIAIHGAGVYVRDGSLDIINSLFSGNWAGDENEIAATSGGEGGAVCVSFSKAEKGNLHAVNSIFVNNTAFGSRLEEGMGGAIYAIRAADMSKELWEHGGSNGTGYRDIEITNCIIANNSATRDGGVHIRIDGYNDDGVDKDGNEYEGDMPKEILWNTILWNNEHASRAPEMGPEYMDHCAYNSKMKSPSTTPGRAANGNIVLNTVYNAADGPRFSQPTTVAGKEGADISAKWNPAAISVLTDAGNGNISTSDTDSQETEIGEYKDWWDKHENRLNEYGYLNDYIRYATGAEQGATRADDTYHRYMGSMDADGNVKDKRIDIGVYEFQYRFTTSDNEAMYVGTEDMGNADGSNWANQTSDLRGAIISMSHPTGNKSEGSSSTISNKRKVYVRGGTYYSPSLDQENAFTINVDNTENKRNYIESLEIIGACTGQAKDGDETKDPAMSAQNFSAPTILICNPQRENPTNALLDITTNGKPVKISGLTFMNTSEPTYKADGSIESGGYGIQAIVNNWEGSSTGTGTATGTGPESLSGLNGKLTLANCSFLQNKGNALNIMTNEEASKGILIYNTLFADGGTHAINAKGKTDIANATFVNNGGYDITGETANVDVVNSVSWRNGGEQDLHFIKQDAESGTGKKNNMWFAKDVENNDVMVGPNFADPDNTDVNLRNYSIRPSFNLLNKGNLTLYNNKVGNDAASQDYDLQNLSRVIGGQIDIGAYECNSNLLPIIYVNTTNTTSGTGASWRDATNDLQSAINLAELYAQSTADSYGYIFVDKASTAKDIVISRPGVKIFGTMNGNETTDKELSEGNANLKEVVDDILGQRKGVIEQTRPATINNLTIADTEDDNRPSIVDGVLANGTITLNNGYLSTSILGVGSEITGSEKGTLYNSLAFGKVNNVKAVNVTAIQNTNLEAPGTLPETAGSANNRTGVTKTNRYWPLERDHTSGIEVTQASDINYWSYQLEETDAANLNKGENEEATQACITTVGHDKDIAGNKRIRDAVDKGCFETWYIPETYTATAEDYPHSKTAIYVDKDQELVLSSGLFTETNTFAPGFVLLKHHAGLRGMGNDISIEKLAIERQLTKNKHDLFVMPFNYSDREITNSQIAQQDGDFEYSIYAYNATKRAAYDYKWDATDGKAWESATSMNRSYITDGLMLTTSDKAKGDITLRIYGRNYTESAKSDKNVNLYVSNNKETWSDNSKFTAKENMSWNLFGSPYLCAMNYSDFKYGRVIYPYDSDADQFRAAINTYEVTAEGKDGYIPAFDAMFTQTATLESQEQFTVKHDQPLTTKGGAYQMPEGNVQLALARTGASRGTASTEDEGSTKDAEVAGQQDALFFNAVESPEAKSDYDMGSDGIKYMTANKPQLYIERNGGRYSLLSAVNIEGSLNIGVSLPEAGEYSLSIPEGCDDSKYETIWLKDAETGKGVDLKNGSYTFQANEAGEMNSRFSISFNRMEADKMSEVSISSTGRGRIHISGLLADDHIAVYAASGTEVTSSVSTSTEESLQLSVSGTVIVEVTRDGKQIAVRKIAVR